MHKNSFWGFNRSLLRDSAISHSKFQLRTQTFRIPYKNSIDFRTGLDINPGKIFCHITNRDWTTSRTSIFYRIPKENTVESWKGILLNLKKRFCQIPYRWSGMETIKTRDWEKKNHHWNWKEPIVKIDWKFFLENIFSLFFFKGLVERISLKIPNSSWKFNSGRYRRIPLVIIAESISLVYRTSLEYSVKLKFR